MAMVTMRRTLGKGHIDLDSTRPSSLYHILRELRGLRVTRSVVASGDLDAVPVTGLTTDDTVIAVLNLTDGADPGDLTVSAGSIEIENDAGADDVMAVIWFDKSGNGTDN